MRFRRILPIAVVVAVLALPMLASSALAAPLGKEVQISVVDYRFDPKTTTVTVGDTVVWTNNGTATHTVTASDGSWDSGPLPPGKTFSHTFDRAGTVAYYCKPHGSPDGSGMAATLMVQAAPAGQAQAPAATQSPAPAPTQAPAAQPAGGTASIDVSDQPLDNGHITLKSVMALQDGWIAVHSNTADNKPGPVIGHAAVKAGMNSNVEITLNPAPKAGDKVWPMLHIDAGQKGVYEFPGPDAPVIQNGDIVMKQITITAAQGSAQPQALPNTGDAEASNLWLAPLMVGIFLMLSGGLLLRNLRTVRRR